MHNLFVLTLPACSERQWQSLWLLYGHSYSAIAVCLAADHFEFRRQIIHLSGLLIVETEAKMHRQIGLFSRHVDCKKSHYPLTPGVNLKKFFVTRDLADLWAIDVPCINEKGCQNRPLHVGQTSQKSVA